MSAAAEFIDAALRAEATWGKAEEHLDLVDNAIDVYGASVGAVRGTVRATLLKLPELDHDAITALASELWMPAVFERRLAAVVLLQSHVALLLVSDLTRLEGFVRSAGASALVDPLAVDVIAPLLHRLDAPALSRADAILDRWAAEPPHLLLSRAAALARGAGRAKPGARSA